MIHFRCIQAIMKSNTEVHMMFHQDHVQPPRPTTMSTTEAARKPTPTTWLDATSNSAQPARQCLSHQCCYSQKSCRQDLVRGTESTQQQSETSAGPLQRASVLQHRRHAMKFQPRQGELVGPLRRASVLRHQNSMG